MPFYLYENWRAGDHKAVIHDGTCGFCNDGAGRAGGYDPRHAQWHGPFDDLDQATAFSNGLPAPAESGESCRFDGQEISDDGQGDLTRERTDSLEHQRQDGAGDDARRSLTEIRAIRPSCCTPEGPEGVPNPD